MDLATAEQAASLVPLVRTVQGQIDLVVSARDSDAAITSGNVIFQADTKEGFSVHPMTSDESKIIYTAMLTILQARLDALNAALGALS